MSETTTIADETADAAVPEEQKTVDQVFKFHHVIDLENFKAFLRLPNQFQHEEIQLKARAAQARKIRELRDPESDGAVVLSEDIDELIRLDDKEPLVDELVNREWWKDHLEAIKDVAEEEEFETIEQDEERLNEIRASDVDDRPLDEMHELEKHIAKHGAAVLERRDERQKPRRESLEPLSIEELAHQVREDRIAEYGRAAFNSTFTIHEWLVGTYTLAADSEGNPKPGRRMFPAIDDLRSADQPILMAIAEGFQEMEGTFARGLTGN